ncbi:MAG: LrgB family protein [Oscillospiraceae bacterium]
MHDIIYNLTALPLFGIVLTIMAYEFGIWLNRKFTSPITTPVLVADILVVLFLLIFRIPYENYDAGGRVIELFIAPATAVLGIKIYEQLKLLKANWLPVIVGSAVGSAVSMTSVIFMCKMFALDKVITMSLIPKSVTMAIAVPISTSKGGLESITAAALVITGIIGAVLAPVFIKIFKVDDKVAAGVAIGTSSHALGTARAIEIGDVEGAMSGIAIGIAGLITVLYSLFV